jgi:hypothetical protein
MAVGSPVAAQNLKERKEIESGQKELDAKLEAVNKKCGTKLKATVNVKSFVGKIDSSHNFSSPHGWCGNVLDGVGDICNDADGKKSLQAKVGQVECHYDAKATSEQVKHYGPIFTLKNKTLSAGYNLETANVGEETKKFLENNL